VKRTLCIDVDDTIRGRDDEPLLGAREALFRFRERGWRILIASARFDPKVWGEQLPFRVEEVRRWLEEHEIPFDDVVVHKPAADLYVDDKGFHFEGDWPAAEEAIRRRLGERG